MTEGERSETLKVNIQHKGFTLWGGTAGETDPKWDFWQCHLSNLRFQQLYDSFLQDNNRNSNVVTTFITLNMNQLTKTSHMQKEVTVTICSSVMGASTNLYIGKSGIINNPVNKRVISPLSLLQTAWQQSCQGKYLVCPRFPPSTSQALPCPGDKLSVYDGSKMDHNYLGALLNSLH